MQDLLKHLPVRKKNWAVIVAVRDFRK